MGRKKTSTWRGRRTLEDRYGFEFKNILEYERFLDFLNNVKDRIGTYYVSGGSTADRIYEVFKYGEEYNMSMSALAKNYQYYEDHLEDFSRIEKIIGDGLTVSPSTYFSRLGVETIKSWKSGLD